jgi:hypothetical protein
MNSFRIWRINQRKSSIKRRIGKIKKRRILKWIKWLIIKGWNSEVKRIKYK